MDEAARRVADADLLTIGRFGRLSGLSVGALRHYDELDLLRPAEVDRFTGYRRYRREQLEGAPPPPATVASSSRRPDSSRGSATSRCRSTRSARSSPRTIRPNNVGVSRSI